VSSEEQNIYNYFNSSMRVLGTTQHSVQYMLGLLCFGSSGRGVNLNHLRPSNAEAKNKRRYVSIPQTRLYDMQTDNFALTIAELEHSKMPTCSTLLLAILLSSTLLVYFTYISLCEYGCILWQIRSVLNACTSIDTLVSDRMQNTVSLYKI